MKPSVRIVADGLVGHQARVDLLNEEGEVIDWLRGVTRVDLTLDVNEVNKATLHLIAVNAETDAQIENLVVNVLPPERARSFVRELARSVGLQVID